jgi:hypothetical protein
MGDGIISAGRPAEMVTIDFVFEILQRLYPDPDLLSRRPRGQTEEEGSLALAVALT